MSFIINRLDDFGRGITFVDGKICFVNNALIDEEIDLEVTCEKAKYFEGITKNVIKESNNRVTPLCKYYNLCGGCNVMHMNYEAELDFKKKKVERILKKYAKLDNIIKEIIPTKRDYYRNKITLKVKDGVIGYFQNKSYDLVNIDKCYICNERINDVIKKLNDINLNGINEIVIRCNKKHELLLYLIGALDNEDVLISKLEDVDNIVINNYKSIKILKGNDYIYDTIGNYTFRISYNSFFQVNNYGVELLYEKVKEYANLTKKEKVLDLYCGTGTIGIYLSNSSKDVFGIEINSNAIEDANCNKKLNNINNIDFLCEDIGKIKNRFKDIDLVILDPPRSGLGLEAISNVLSVNPKKIIYVSCEPLTLARDLNILKEKYKIIETTLIDMFPNTYHCESITVLERR